MFYPQSQYRTTRNLALQERLDKNRDRFAEWRRTCIPAGEDPETPEWLNSPVLLDELYSRETLKGVRGMVERTLAFSRLSLADVPKGPALVYLREAARCYVLGLPQAAIALARAAVEASLKARSAGLLGQDTVEDAKLGDLIDDIARRGRLLSPVHRTLAQRVQRAGNDVLHGKPSNDEQAFSVLEAARTLVLAPGQDGK